MATSLPIGVSSAATSNTAADVSFFPPKKITGGGYFGPAPSAGAGLSWTLRAGVPSGITVLAPPSSSAGSTVMGDVANGIIYLSTDGGHTFTSQDSGLGTVNRAANGAGTVWLMGTQLSGYYVSTDNGVDWAGPDTLPVGFATQNVILAAASGAPNDLFVLLGDSTGNNNYAVSTNNGGTFTVPATYNNNGWIALIWDGTQFVGLARQAVTSLVVVVTSPDGATWTETVIAAGNNPSYTAGLSHDTSTGKYLIGADVTTGNPFVRTATTPAGLSTASDVNTNLNAGNGLFYTIVGDGLFWAFDASGGVASSHDGDTWTRATLNLPFGASGHSATYDATHNIFIATDGSGDIVTFP